MSNQGRIQQAARFVFEERQTRNPFGPIPATFAPRTIDEAYAAQDELHKLLADTYGPLAGYKIALTTRAMQQMVGLNDPVAAGILKKTIHHSPATIPRTEFVHLGIECEIALQLGSDLSPDMAPYNRDRVANAVSAAMAAFELIDDRHADYSTLAEQFLTSIVDNVFNAGIVLGSPQIDWQRVDLAAARGELSINGESAGEGHGSDVMGHPLEALVWLANTLAKQGKGLTRGMIVMTGSVVTTKFLKPGDSAMLMVDGLGEAKLKVS